MEKVKIKTAKEEEIIGGWGGVDEQTLITIEISILQKERKNYKTKTYRK